MRNEPSFPSRLKARAFDMGIAATSTVTVQQIHLVMDFNGRLDPGRLRKALRLLLISEPILQYRFVPRLIRPHWKRLSHREIDRCDLLQVKGLRDHTTSDVDLQSFLGASFSVEIGPQITALLQPRPSGDRLVLKVHHQVTDGGGVKELGYKLSNIYHKLAETPHYRPTPRNGSRSAKQLYRRYTPWELSSIIFRELHDVLTKFKPVRALAFPVTGACTGRPRFSFFHLDPKRVECIARHGKNFGATLNDELNTALLRALVRHLNWEGTTALRLVGTVDLRRYLPDQATDGLCNFSGFSVHTLGTNLGIDYDDTLIRIKKEIDDAKSNFFGLGSILVTYIATFPVPFAFYMGCVRWFFRHLKRTQKGSICITNFGPIDPGALDFGYPTLRHAYLTAPASEPVSMIFGISGFRRTLTVSNGSFPSAIPPNSIAALYELIDKELPSSLPCSPSFFS